MFTPDSHRLVLGLVNVGEVLVIELPSVSLSVGGEDDERSHDIKVVKCFGRGKVDGRVVLNMKNETKKKFKRSRGKKVSEAPAVVNGHVGEQSMMDVDGALADGEVDKDEREDEEDDLEINQGQNGSGLTRREDAWIGGLAVSDDGQWLAVSDLAGQVSVYNLDTLQVSR